MIDLSYYDAGYQLAPYYHNSVGITLGGLILIRVLWRIRDSKPPVLASHSTFENHFLI